MKMEIWNPHSRWLPVYRWPDLPRIRRAGVDRTRPVSMARNAILAQLVTLRLSR